MLRVCVVASLSGELMTSVLQIVLALSALINPKCTLT